MRKLFQVITEGSVLGLTCGIVVVVIFRALLNGTW